MELKAAIDELTGLENRDKAYKKIGEVLKVASQANGLRLKALKERDSLVGEVEALKKELGSVRGQIGKVEESLLVKDKEAGDRHDQAMMALRKKRTEAKVEADRAIAQFAKDTLAADEAHRVLIETIAGDKKKAQAELDMLQSALENLRKVARAA